MKTPHTFSDPLPPVDCRWVAERLHAHVEGEAAPLESRLIRTHLQNCSDCRGLEQAFQNDRRFFLEAALDSPALPATFSKKVLRKIERMERDELRRKRKAYAGRMLGGAAAALVLAAAGLFGLSFFRAPESPEGLRSARLAAVDPASTPVRASGAPQLATREDGGLLASVGEVAVAAEVFVPSFHHVLSLASDLLPAVRAAEALTVDDPCRADPNKDGKTDIIDVAYSCQLLLVGEPPNTLEACAIPRPLSPECDEFCIRA
jgi:predicted anti-sigma-YlaC factor YlaD